MLHGRLGDVMRSRKGASWLMNDESDLQSTMKQGYDQCIKEIERTINARLRGALTMHLV
jgi:hypothetical protein